MLKTDKSGAFINSILQWEHMPRATHAHARRAERTPMAAQQIASTLGTYAQLLEEHGLVSATANVAPELAVNNVTDDSRKVAPNTLFVCKGAAFKREYLLSALENGAIAYVSAHDFDVDAPFIQVNDIRKTLAVLADAAYDHPSGKLQVCAFTGTKGKTTSTYYLKSIFTAQAKRSGAHAPAFFSSVQFDDGVNADNSKLTTPESFELEGKLANAVSAGCTHVVMEASSQALKYGRTYCVDFAVGAFTNIGEDHISPIEHPTFEDYFASKLKIFDQSRDGVVNLDMDHAAEVLETAQKCERVVTYSLADATADVFCESIQHSDEGIVATIRTPRFTRDILIPTPVKFNVANALGAIACAEALGVDEDCIVEGMAHVHVPGRMELYPTKSGRIVGIVDFAHNGMSLETLLRDVRENYPTRDLCVVFGATGGKGLDRRETMGVAAGKFADRIVITEDDPGPEEAADICATIAKNVSAQNNENWQIELDRNQAIRKAVFETVKPAVVIVTGKGEETRMLRKNGAEPCEADADMLKRALAAFEEDGIAR